MSLETLFLEQSHTAKNGTDRFAMHNLSTDQLAILRDLVTRHHSSNHARLHTGYLTELQRSQLAMEQVSVDQLYRVLTEPQSILS